MLESTLDQNPLIMYSDDGSTVISVVDARIWIFLHAIRAQLGHPLPLCYVRIGAVSTLPLSFLAFSYTIF